MQSHGDLDSWLNAERSEACQEDGRSDLAVATRSAPLFLVEFRVEVRIRNEATDDLLIPGAGRPRTCSVPRRRE
jgi:hypothetical protein